MAVHPKTQQSLLKLPVDGGMIKQRGSGFDHHGEIHANLDRSPVYPKILAKPTFYPITADCVANFPANTDPQAHPGKTGAGDDHELCGMATPTLPPGLRVLPGGPQAATWREALIRPGNHGGKSLGRDGYHQALAPLGTPPPEYIDAILGAHPDPEAVGPLATNFAWLIGSLAHDTHSLLRVGPVFCKGHC
jgi:hypothetical protein